MSRRRTLRQCVCACVCVCVWMCVRVCVHATHVYIQVEQLRLKDEQDAHNKTSEELQLARAALSSTEELLQEVYLTIEYVLLL